MAFNFIIFTFTALVVVSGTKAEECFSVGPSTSDRVCEMTCQWKYPKSVARSVDLKTVTCECCYTPAMPFCTSNDGECDLPHNCGDDCCEARCKATYSDLGDTVSGICQLDSAETPINHCVCTYYCDHPPTI